MARIDFKGYLKEFIRYNRLRIFKIILYSLILLYFLFLLYYNYFRVTLSYSLELSWPNGILLALLTTIIIVISLDILSFYLKVRKTPLDLLELEES